MQRTSVLMLTLIGAVAGTPLHAQELTVCMEGHTSLDADTMRVFGEELKAIAHASGRSIRLFNQTGDCRGIRLVVKSISKTDISAVGTAGTKDKWGQPVIEVYATTIATLVRSKLPVHVGRGMARVVAHGIGHSLMAAEGGSQDAITGPQLLVRDSRKFRLPATEVAGGRKRGLN